MYLSLFVFLYILFSRNRFTRRQKQKRNCAMIRIYFCFYLFKSISALARLCTLLVFSFLLKPTKKYSIVSFLFFFSLIRFLFFILFVLFISLLRSIIKTKLQICVLLLFECFVFHRLKQTYK